VSAATPSPLDGTPAVRNLAEAALRLELGLQQGRGIMWERSPRLSGPDNSGVRGSNLADTVPAIVMDERRLAVRASVVEGERLLERAVAALGVARRHVEAALADGS
jgi:hypothetical protein